MFSKKLLFYFIPILLLIIAGLYLAGVFSDKKNENANRDFPQIEASGVLNVVAEYNSINYFASTDTIAGFMHDMLRAFARQANLRLNVSVENNLEKCMTGLEAGSYDLIARNIPVNNALKNRISFTQPIVRNRLVLVQRIPAEGEDRELIRNHLKLAKKTVYVSKSSPVTLRLQNLSREIGDTIFVIEDNLYEASQLIMMVASGEIEFAVCDAVIANKLKKTIPEIDIDTDIGFTHLEAWAVRNNSPVLLDSINSWIARFQDTREFQNIYNRYYK